MTTLQLPSALPPSSHSATAATSRQESQLSVEWVPGLLAAIRDFVATTYYSKHAHGVDLGGILLGHRDGDRLMVLSWLPIERGSDATAHFHLNSSDERGLSQQLSCLGKTHQVLGWFRSRNSGALRAEDHDRDLHQKFFPGAPLFLIIRPSHQRPSDVHFFMLSSDSTFLPLRKLQLLPPQIPGVSLSPTPAAPASHRSAWTLRSALFQSVTLFAVFSLTLFCSLLVLQWFELANRSLPKETLNIQIKNTGADLNVTWNNSSSPLLSSKAAQISFGGEKLKLSRSELIRGSLQLPMKTGTLEDIEISLQVGNREEVARIIPSLR
ncbi:MAG: hypothetical protein ACK5TN_15490 [Acidobacteriota bacterium]